MNTGHNNIISMNACTQGLAIGIYGWLQRFGNQFCHTADNSEAQEGQQEATQAKKQDQSDSDEALYLPPLPPDQLDTVVKVTAAHTAALLYFK